MGKKIVIAIYWLLVGCSCTKNSKQNEAIKNEPTLKDGDILFQTCSNSSQSDAIALATDCKYTHVGILFRPPQNANWYVYEAVGPVKLTPLKAWIKNGDQDHFTVKRYKSLEHTFSKEESKKLYRAGLKFKGKPYDLQFLWNDRAIYCSELVWKIYHDGLKIELCKLQEMKTYALHHPEVQKKIIERYGNRAPLNEKMVAPADIFRSNQLISVDQFTLPE